METSTGTSVSEIVSSTRTAAWNIVCSNLRYIILLRPNAGDSSNSTYFVRLSPLCASSSYSGTARGSQLSRDILAYTESVLPGITVRFISLVGLETGSIQGWILHYLQGFDLNLPRFAAYRYRLEASSIKITASDCSHWRSWPIQHQSTRAFPLVW